MSASFDVFQQTFALSLLSNQASKYEAAALYTTGIDPLETQLASNIKASLALPAVATGLGSDWQIAWGPAVWRTTSSKAADNAAVVFYNPAVTFDDGTSAPTYVVAIAATNSISTYDWWTEDFKVSTTVDWTQYNPAQPPVTVTQHDAQTPFISSGTAIGVGNIAKLTPTDPSHGKTSLSDFIGQTNTTAGSGTRLIFTGHSLAGALAPTFALKLKEQGTLSNFSQVLAYPTAGASPGNNVFAQRFANAFPAHSAGTQPWQNWNMLIHNQYDIVPHAWNPDTLAQMRTLYGNSDAQGKTKLPVVISLSILAALKKSKTSNIVYTALQNLEFSSGFSGPAPATAKDYMMIAAAQHVQAYTAEIFSPDFPPVGPWPLVPGISKYFSSKEQVSTLADRLEETYMHNAKNLPAGVPEQIL